jgi:hypothetical protein
MISPTPGIRRPSYNGAPAMPTSAHFQTAKVIILSVPVRLSLTLTIFLPSVFPIPDAPTRADAFFRTAQDAVETTMQ